MAKQIRQIQETLLEKEDEMKLKESRIVYLKQEKIKRDGIIRKLNARLDKWKAAVSTLHPAIPAQGTMKFGGAIGR